MHQGLLRKHHGTYHRVLLGCSQSCLPRNSHRCRCCDYSCDCSCSYQFVKFFIQLYHYRPMILPTSLIKVRPILRSSPCLVNGIPVALATLRLSTSMPIARRGEKEVPGIPSIFICGVVLNSSAKVGMVCEAFLRINWKRGMFPHRPIL